MKYILMLLVITSASSTINAQGCIAIKGGMPVCSRPETVKGWDLNFNTRYFKSHKHFIGTVEQKEREKNNTEVINHTFELDIIATRTFNQRWSMAMILPIMNFKRSSLYEHDRVTRHSTGAFGIGDARVSINRWMLNPATHSKGNFQLGVGIKLPTGNYNSQDYFYKKADSVVLGAVDQSIQPGDGGTGITFEWNSYFAFSHQLSVYSNFFYLINPKEVNGTSTSRGSAPSASAIKYNTDVMSVPDLYMGRAGISYMIKNFTFSGGLRMEGLPSHDLVGGSRGFRRPGYIISGEPTASVTSKKTTFTLSVPFALKRNRTQSDSDKRRSIDTGTHVQGDAAFADYLVNVGISVKL